jgi:hypothetical protein
MKPRFAVAVLLVIALAIPVTVLAQQSKSAKEKEVRAVVDAINEANLKGGEEAASVMDKYLAKDMVRIPSNGSIFGKADMVDGFRTGKIKVSQMEPSDVKINIYGNTAVVTGVFKSVSTVVDASYNNTNR